MIEEILSTFPGLQQILTQESPIYLIGGAIRDRLMNRQVHDLDFVTGFDARRLARKVANHFNGAFFVLDEKRAIYRVVLHIENQKRVFLDFARFQGENLEEDLNKRDFSMNAVAISINNPMQTFDPCAGILDIKNNIIRTCSATSFIDDPLRILRAVRFATYYSFRIEPQTISLLREAIPDLERVAHERIRDELFFLLESRRTRTAFHLLDRLNVLDAIMPELSRLKNVPQNPPHVYPVWEHSLSVLDELEDLFSILVGEISESHAENIKFAAASLRLGRFRNHMDIHFSKEIVAGRNRRSLLFLAALFHDVGKADTLTIDEEGRSHFFEHETRGSQIIAEWGNWLSLSQAEISWEKTLLQHHMRVHHLVKTGRPVSRRAIYHFFRDCGAAGVDICLLTLADFLATYGIEYPEDLWDKYLDTCNTLLDAWWEKKEEAVQPVRLLDGNDVKEIFKLSSGPMIGRLLEELKEAQATGEVVSRQQAIAFAEKWLNRQQ